MRTYHVANGRVVVFHAVTASLIIVRHGGNQQSRFELLDGETLQVDATKDNLSEAVVEIRVGEVFTSTEITKHAILKRLRLGYYRDTRRRQTEHAWRVVQALARGIVCM